MPYADDQRQGTARPSVQSLVTPKPSSKRTAKATKKATPKASPAKGWDPIGDIAKWFNTSDTTPAAAAAIAAAQHRVNSTVSGKALNNGPRTTDQVYAKPAAKVNPALRKGDGSTSSWSGGGGSFAKNRAASSMAGDPYRTATPTSTPTASTPSVLPTSKTPKAPSYASDPSVAAALSALLGYKGGTAKVNFDGNLQSYVDQYKAMMPTVDYGSLIGDAENQAAAGDKTIQGVYNGLGAYITGLNGTIKDDYGQAADGYKDNANAASGIINQAADSSRQSVASALAAIGGMSEANPDPNGTGLAHQQEAGGDVAARLQSSLDANTSNLSSTLAFNNTAGTASQMQGAEQRADLQKSLAKMVAQYRTQQSQENAQNALQALSMGTSQFNNDRSYAQSEAARQQAAIDAKYSRLTNRYNILQDADNSKYSRWYQQQQDAASSAAAAASSLQAQAKFQYQQDNDAANRASREQIAANGLAAKQSAAAATPSGLSNSEKSLWASIYGSVLKSTGKLKQAQKAANTAVLNARGQ